MKPLNAADGLSGVSMVKVRNPGVAPDAIWIFTPTLVSVLLLTIAVTPFPLNVTAVAPAKAIPLIVADRFVPATPDLELMLMMIGC